MLTFTKEILHEILFVQCQTMPSLPISVCKYYEKPFTDLFSKRKIISIKKVRENRLVNVNMTAWVDKEGNYDDNTSNLSWLYALARFLALIETNFVVFVKSIKHCLISVIHVFKWKCEICLQKKQKFLFEKTKNKHFPWLLLVRQERNCHTLGQKR